jgi:hypothetical protein
MRTGWLRALANPIFAGLYILNTLYNPKLFNKP